jgi:signal recognition particle subunit SRP19
MAHPRVEEVDTDSDPDEMDITSLPADSNMTLLPVTDIARTVNQPLPSNAPHPMARPLVSRAEAAGPPPESKNWHLLYPIYFDASVTRSEGRRVPADRAVKNPLAMKIAEAITEAGMSSVFEPGKTHPKDWANPGRVRVRLRDEKGGSWVAAGVKNSTS